MQKNIRVNIQKCIMFIPYRSHKQGQVTIFILIGILILFTVAFFIFYIVQKDALSKEDTSAKVAAETYIQSCMEQQLEDILTLVALQGGYYTPPPQALMYVYEDTYSYYFPYLAYYIYYYNDISITSEELEEEIAKGIEETYASCTTLPFSYTLSTGIPAIEVTLTSDSVEATIDLNAHFTIEQNTITLSPITLEVPSSISELHAIAQEITATQLLYDDQWCVACLSLSIKDTAISLEREEIIRDEGRDIIYILYDQNNLTYRFVHGFPYFAVPVSPMLYSIKNLTAVAGEEFTYLVRSRGQNLTFSDTTSLFEIDPLSGNITFTPQETDIGSSLITILATDAYNQSTEINTLLFITGNRGIETDALASFTVVVGEPFEYTVSASAETSLTYSDTCIPFDIDANTGVIQFTPTSDTPQEIDCSIFITDEAGHIAQEELYMVIVS